MIIGYNVIGGKNIGQQSDRRVIQHPEILLFQIQSKFNHIIGSEGYLIHSPQMICNMSCIGLSKFTGGIFKKLVPSAQLFILFCNHLSTCSPSAYKSHLNEDRDLVNTNLAAF